jgi:LysR family transcriptional regulator for metE and metH
MIAAMKEAARPGILEVRHLQLVAAIVAEGSVTGAGEVLHLTQSALSHQLLDLEERLGTPLFHRSRKQMTPTDAGQRLLAVARDVLARLADTEHELRLFAANRRGSIRLTTECYTVYHWLPTVMKQFAREYPAVDLRIEVDATDSPFEALAAGKLDVAFVTSDVAPRGIEMEPLFRDEMKVVVAPDHRFASQEFVKPGDLAGETLLTYSALKGNFIYERLLRPAGIEPKKHLQVRLTEAIIELVKAGAGVALMAEWAISPYAASGAVVTLPLTRRGVERQWRAASVASRPMPPFMRTFIDMVAAEGPRAQHMSLMLASPSRRRAASASR